MSFVVELAVRHYLKIMERLKHLISELKKTADDDWWLNEVSSIIEEDDDFFLDDLKVYGKALEVLDEGSWREFAKKAAGYIKQDSRRRGKQQFTNILNEVLAYEYLVSTGRSSVQFVPESAEGGSKNKPKSPDIQFLENGEKSFCEVKTIGVSEEELDRAEADEIYSATVYYSLSDGFLNKLSSDITYAASQIPTNSSNNLIYVIVNFDDFVGLYYKEYEKQIRHHLSQAHESVQVYLRIGLRGRFSIQHMPRNA